jgi:hypothetical protein
MLGNYIIDSAPLSRTISHTPSIIKIVSFIKNYGVKYLIKLIGEFRDLQKNTPGERKRRVDPMQQ